jgi:hypothetical protein
MWADAVRKTQEKQNGALMSTWHRRIGSESRDLSHREALDAGHFRDPVLYVAAGVSFARFGPTGVGIEGDETVVEVTPARSPLSGYA